LSFSSFLDTVCHLSTLSSNFTSSLVFAMFLKFTHFSSLFFLFSLLPASYAHSGVAPQLGVNGTPKISDVKRPSRNKPCGNGVNIASALDTSTAVPASSDGEVKVTVLNFNAGADGSRQVISKVDPSGTGKNFVKMTITVNGDPVPKENTGSQDVVAKLPAGTRCTGGSKKNKCLVQFVTNRGFGNCVVVSQGPSSTSSDAPAPSPNVGLDISDRAVEGEDAGAKAKKKAGIKKKKGEKGKDGKKKKKKDKAATAKRPADNDGVDGENKAGGDKKDKDKKKVAAKKSESGKGKVRGAGKDKKKKQSDDKKKAGTRAPRALLADLVVDREVDNQE